jgi:hypothetical protein
MDYTNTGWQANPGRRSSGSGGGVILNVGGKSFAQNSPEGKRFIAGQQQQRLTQAQGDLAAQTNLATAEVEADAANYEAEQNRAQGQQAFQLALSQAGGRRMPGGGIARGGSGRRGMSIGAATGGLAAANAAARRRTQGNLATARVAADPSNQLFRRQIGSAQAMLANNPAANSPRRPISAPRIR